MVKFVLLFQGRTGSSYLMDALNRHSRITAAGEILADYSKPEPQLKRIQELYSKYDSENYKACGFKTKLRDIKDKDKFKKLLIEKKFQIIYLERKNVVKTVVSKFNAYRLNNQKGLWNITDNTQRLESQSIEVEEFDKWLRGTLAYKEELESFLSNIELPVLVLYYEDLILSETDVFEKIFNFLEVEYEDVKGKFIKYTNDDLKKSLENFDELKMYYKGSVYEDMFEEILINDDR